MPEMMVPAMTPAQITDLQDKVARDWCKPLADAAVPFRVTVREGRASTRILDVASEEDAALIVVGRRGLGGFTELLLGSTSRELVHHTTRPLVLVP
jgi:nucleotide-binding universal stress UspA family protein